MLLDKCDNFGVFRDAGSNNLLVKVKEVMKLIFVASFLLLLSYLLPLVVERIVLCYEKCFYFSFQRSAF